MPRSPADGRYHLWYHAGASTGNLPTDVYHASSADLLQWVVSPGTPVLKHQGTGFAYDQVAGPSPTSVGGQSFMWYDGDNNKAGAAGIGLALAGSQSSESA